MKKLFYSAIMLVGMLLNVSVNAQTSILPLSSDDLFKAYDNYQKGVYAKAYEIFKSLSDNGDEQAAYGLGVCYYNGRGTTKNLEEALKCFEKSYNRGNKSAAFIIGKCYFYGQGVEKDFYKAKMYLTQAANQDNNAQAKALLLKINPEELELERKKMIADVDVVDLGLPSGTLWADRNVGAKLPEDYGDYFAWGETTTKTKYDWSTYKYANGDYKKLTKYCTKSDYGNNGYTDSRTTLERSDDAATANWGSDWCMPTQAQFQVLLDNCTNEWTTNYQGKDVAGRIFKSKKNGNTIFFPAAGFRNDSHLGDDGSYGTYWSSSLLESSPWYLWFISSRVDWDNGGRYVGRTVRAVRCKN